MNIINEISYWGLGTVIQNYSLIYKDAGHKFLLKYHQIESSFARNTPAVKECRGLVLEKTNLTPMSYPFYRFFNLGEGTAAELDYNTTRVYKKEDDSLIGLYWDFILNEWCTQTSGTPDGLTPVGDTQMLFKDLFSSTLNKPLDNFNKDYCYIFELCTPYNIVVTPHKESYTKCLAIRNMKTLQELSHENVKSECERLNISQIESFQFNFKDISSIANTLPPTEEGYVACDANFNRVKIKNPAYVALHHLKGALTKAGLFEVIFTGEIDEVLTLMPDYAEELNKRNKFFNDCIKEIETFIRTLNNAPYTTKKDFALWLQKELKNYSQILSTISGNFYKFADAKINGSEVMTLNAREILTKVNIDKLETIFNS